MLLEQICEELLFFWVEITPLVLLKVYKKIWKYIIQVEHYDRLEKLSGPHFVLKVDVFRQEK